MQNIIPGFDRFEQVGEGLFAVVWKAHQVSLDRTVAIKIIKPQFTSNIDEVRAFINEARSSAKLKHHNIIQVYDVAEQEGIYYFVMEYVAGSTVYKMLQDEGAMSEKKAMKIVSDVADALDEAWEKGSLIHRNISPRNIMMDADSSVKLADLGLAKLADFASASDQASNTQFRGLYNYISPEQALRTKLDARSDMYSLGACLYHMVTGEMPFDVYTPSQILNSITKETIPNPKDIKPQLSQGLVRLISRLMMKDPKNRYRNWKEAIKDIKKIAAGHSIAAPQIPGAISTIDGAMTKGATAPLSNIRIPASAAVRVQPSAGSAMSHTEIVEKYEKMKASSGRGIPSFIRLPFWIGLSLFWAYLCVTMLSLPPFEYDIPKPFNSVILDDSSRAKPPRTPATPDRPKNLPETPASTYQPGTGTTTEKTNGDTKPEEKTPEKQPEKPVVEPPSVAANKLDKDLVKAVADSLMAEKFDKALAVVKKAQEATNVEATVKADIESFKKLVTDVSKMNSAVERYLVDSIGNELIMKVGGVNRKVTVRAVIGNNINIEYSTGAGPPQTSTFQMSALEPLDKAKLLGKLNTPSKNAMKFILCMKGKDYEGARDVAGKCGPLSDLFRSEVEAKNPPPEPKEKPE
ncbi:MAG: hypothetical protein C0404_09750 [Verrucomicrobia bacterium]|nr:hypothetical protein [Verrucomicrobiota bacterium]